MLFIVTNLFMDTKSKKMQREAGKMLSEANKLKKQSEKMQQDAGKMLSDANKIEKKKKNTIKKVTKVITK